MPIRIADSTFDVAALKSLQEEFIIFFSTRVDGVPWCPDCIAVDDLIQSTFSGSNAALLVYIDKLPWKNREDPVIFRQEPFNIAVIPTVVKLKDGQEVARLVDQAEISAGLEQFVST